MQNDKNDHNAGRIRLSVIIPTYNCIDYLDECFVSVLCQLPEDCELIAVDDGSDDGTAKALASYADAHPGYRYVINEHKGASGARNAGLDICKGRYVAFVDCDDCLKSGFLQSALPMLTGDADLFIFGIERIPLDGDSRLWTVRDGFFPDSSAFADEYVRTRRLMVYSNCNKFYRKEIIDRFELRFDEKLVFGEDRLFNYAFLKKCGSIVTSSQIMLQYIQRSGLSMSSRQIHGYYDIIRYLHEMKMDCFLSLSAGTTQAEKLDFLAYDVSREMAKMTDRFKDNPEEKEEILPRINSVLFESTDDKGQPVSIIIVLGGPYFRYNVERALEIGADSPGVKYIVSGAGLLKDGRTEAECMSEALREHGVSPEDIYMENSAGHTRQSLELSADIIHAIRAKTGDDLLRTGIVTAGYNIPRTRLLAESMAVFEDDKLHWFGAYGNGIQRETWFENPMEKEIVLQEMIKTIKLCGKAKW